MQRPSPLSHTHKPAAPPPQCPPTRIPGLTTVNLSPRYWSLTFIPVPLKIMDGGDAYTPAPAIFGPFRRTIGYWTSVAIGRWLGGLLGYKPFFKEYTTDWDYAVAKMRGSFFQRHLVENAYSSQRSWQGQRDLEAQPLNAEYGAWTEDLSPDRLDLGEPAYEMGVWVRSDKEGTLISSDEMSTPVTREDAV